ncbi:MAG: flavodoxin [Candidatus Omnitrophica bacterium]|nr:flavodoxin [Candidatus Omnitrophota bacterium]
MKILVVYYSFDGNTRLIAETIAQETGADSLELRTEDEPRSKGFSKYFWGGRQVFMKVRPALFALDKDPAQYDFLFIGTPVWAFAPAPAMSAFLEKSGIRGKKVALFCCSGGGMGRTLARMEEALAGNVIAGRMHFIEPRRTQKASVEKARRWAREMM